MDDFRNLRFRAPPVMVGAAYKEIGVAAVAMGGGDILPALEKDAIDAAEWCCPQPDSVFIFQKVLYIIACKSCIKLSLMLTST